MNANELADELDACANETMESLFKNKTKAGSLLWNIKVTDVEQRKQAATMLRQLQAENEELKLKLNTTLTNRNLRTYDGKEV